MSSSNAFDPVRISTDAFPAHRRLELWQEIYGRTIAKFDIEPLDDQLFHAELTARVLPGVGIAVGSRSDSNYVMTRELASHTGDNLLFSVLTSGTGTIAQRGREATIGTGEALVMLGNEPGNCALRHGGSFLTLSEPREAIAPVVRDLDAALVRPMDVHNEGLQLLKSYIGLINERKTLSDPNVLRAVTTHIHDLLATALGPTSDASSVAEMRGLRSARLHAIKLDIDQHLKNPDLSINELALRHQTTPRYIQRLFEAEGTTLTRYIAGRRLTEARRMLSDPRLLHQGISEIAFRVGFSDLSYFSRSFRRHFGLTPSDVRSQVQADRRPR